MRALLENEHLGQTPVLAFEEHSHEVQCNPGAETRAAGGLVNPRPKDLMEVIRQVHSGRRDISPANPVDNKEG